MAAIARGLNELGCTLTATSNPLRGTEIDRATGDLRLIEGSLMPRVMPLMLIILAQSTVARSCVREPNSREVTREVTRDVMRLTVEPQA